MNKDSKEIKKFNINILEYDDYKKTKEKSKKLKIKVIYKLTGFKFFICDDKDNLLCKVKKKIFGLNDKYIIYNPYDSEKGDLTYRSGRENKGYDIYLYKGNSFSILQSKYSDHIDYELDKLPIYYKGDVLGSNFEIINKETKKLIAKVSYYSHGSKGMEYNIEFKDTTYNLEILLGIICTKLIQVI